ncbi:hypothetical protein HETIRDRAFT_421539 [Heterobasidion irregulare TC 32-1]|uniref:Uncharacterized protein n=1 Tax=Heterobasidion irregulare (strain TC 32-1) TaxID=747525 RepID=W4JV50_HETIT|nr:uncharacterized protein HETIRDRAFT_421539 [Heterobasidion irregulare TC 32-1]ETW77412.1 hypothetical protein HETIRDRAFT_421539 [Heterobasidion irregulare TC 32-1]
MTRQLALARKHEGGDERVFHNSDPNIRDVGTQMILRPCSVRTSRSFHTQLDTQNVSYS